MNVASSSRAQDPGRTFGAPLPIRWTVAQLAALSGMTRRTMMRWLEEKGVRLRRRGKGTKRVHVSVMVADLAASAPEILEGIQWGALLTETRRPPAIVRDDEGEDDDEE